MRPHRAACGVPAFGFDLPLERILKEVTSLQEGGTLAVLLGIHALQHGLNARIHSYNLRVLDPTWEQLPRQEVRRRIVEQMRHKRGQEAAHRLRGLREVPGPGRRTGLPGPGPEAPEALPGPRPARPHRPQRHLPVPAACARRGGLPGAAGAR